MSKILLIGNGPLPHKDQIQAHNAASLRTYFFKKALAHEKVEVTSVLINLSSNSQLPILNSQSNTFNFNKDDRHLKAKIEKIIQNFKPDGIVSVNTYPSFVAAQLKTDLPLWCDLNGWVMAEAQSQAGVMKSNALLPYYFNFERTVAKRADRFSTVSTPQKFTLIGELATFGRLNYQTNEEALVHVTPNYFEAFEATPPRNRKTDDHEFRVFWCGGYNTWVDADTLFKGLEYAMEKDSQIKFVSTGGTIEGLDNVTFARFKSMIDQSRFKDRFEFLGWVEFDALPQLFANADCGINVNLSNYESEIGARNRLNEMLVRGLPIITSLNAEITHDLKKAGLAETFCSGDFKAFGDCLLKLKNKPELALHYAEDGQEFAKANYDYLVHTHQLRAWCQNPQISNDHGIKINMKKMSAIQAVRHSLKQDGWKKTLNRVWKKIRK